jgi:peptidoglycan hydrolase FlgJ
MAATATAAPAVAAGATPGAAQPVPPEVRRAAEDFESVFISQILSQMRVGFGPPGPAGAAGGADDPFASMLRDEYARIVSRSGGIGLADAVTRELLRAQEVA